MSTHQPPLPDVNLLQNALQDVMQQQEFCLRAARALDAAGLQVLSHALRFTARQEAEHASILRAMQGDAPSAAPPPDLPGEADAILQAAIRREEASRDRLQCAARKAQESGFPRAAQTLQRIAETEDAHARRFRRCLQRLQDRTLLEAPRATSWFCLKCGGIHHGCGAPESCEACGGSRGHFIRSDFTPFACG